MKKTTKKLTIACLALLSCATIGAATGCSAVGGVFDQISGAIGGLTHTHEYVMKFDANNHWKE